MNSFAFEKVLKKKKIKISVMYKRERATCKIENQKGINHSEKRIQ